MPEKIIITVPRKKKPKRKSGGGISRGPIIPGKKGEYLSRRRVAGGINFYDFGYIKDSDIWVTPPLDVDLSDPDFNNKVTTYFNKPLSVPLNDWKTTYKKITKTLGYKMTVKVNNSETVTIEDTGKWKDTGLKVDTNPITELFIFSTIADSDRKAYEYGSALMNLSIQLKTASSSFKITDTPEYSADAVDFDFIANTDSVDIFINSAYVSATGQEAIAYGGSSTTNGVNFPNPAFRWVFIGNCLQGVGQTGPAVRGSETVHSGTSVVEYISSKAFVFDRNTAFTHGTDFPTSNDTAWKYGALSMMNDMGKLVFTRVSTALSGNTYGNFTRQDGGSTFAQQVCIEGDPNPYTASPTSAGGTFQSSYSSSSVSGNTSGRTGALAAAIRKGEQTYYVWK